MSGEFGVRFDAALSRGAAFTFRFAGDPVTAYPGETIAAALMAAGERILRDTRTGMRRGVYCGMGVCFECLVVVDGRPAVRACTTLATPGMDVQPMSAPERRR